MELAQKSIVSPMPHDEASYFRNGVHLMRSVIRRAQLEAEGKHCVETTRHENFEVIQREAREWISNDSISLRHVWWLCDFPRGTYEEFVTRNWERYSRRH